MKIKLRENKKHITTRLRYYHFLIWSWQSSVGSKFYLVLSIYKNSLFDIIQQSENPTNTIQIISKERSAILAFLKVRRCSTDICTRQQFLKTRNLIPSSQLNCSISSLQNKTKLFYLIVSRAPFSPLALHPMWIFEFFHNSFFYFSS